MSMHRDAIAEYKKPATLSYSLAFSVYKGYNKGILSAPLKEGKMKVKITDSAKLWLEEGKLRKGTEVFLALDQHNSPCIVLANQEGQEHRVLLFPDHAIDFLDPLQDIRAVQVFYLEGEVFLYMEDGTILEGKMEHVEMFLVPDPEAIDHAGRALSEMVQDIAPFKDDRDDLF